MFTFILQYSCYSNQIKYLFQGPKAGPEPWPIEACFAHTTLLQYISKTFGEIFCPPPPPNDQILDLLVNTILVAEIGDSLAN